jgi:hypothetical protein
VREVVVTDEQAPKPEQSPSTPADDAEAQGLLSLPSPQVDRVHPASDITLGVLLLIGAVSVLRYLEQIPSEAEMILRIAVGGFVISGVGVIVPGLRRLRTLRSGSSAETPAEAKTPSRLRALLDRRLLIVPVGELLVVLGIGIFIMLMPRLGFVVASATLILVTLVVYRERRWYWVGPAAALAILGLDWLFFGFLNLRTF